MLSSILHFSKQNRSVTADFVDAGDLAGFTQGQKEKMSSAGLKPKGHSSFKEFQGSSCSSEGQISWEMVYLVQQGRHSCSSREFTKNRDQERPLLKA